MVTAWQVFCLLHNFITNYKINDTKLLLMEDTILLCYQEYI